MVTVNPGGAKKVGTVLFDLDGTLVNTFRSIYEALNHTLRAFGGSPLEEETIRPLIGVPLWEILKDYIRPNDVHLALETYRERQLEVLFQDTHLMPYVRETLEELRERHRMMGVVTNKPGWMARNILDHYDLTAFFGVVLGVDEVTRPKPRGDGILEAARELGAASASLLYVGDSVVDVLAARDAGVDVLIVEGGASDCRDLAKMDVVVVPDLRCLVRFIQEAAAPGPRAGGPTEDRGSTVFETPGKQGS